ncbi:hypothetical protein DPMN_094337 [Dreissena polymorpha]|uniref:Uncharacterized protein n=1 Tax=Dreissena polymorpha TaxID=45954 RepID=A0A9D4R3G0_DREPO|nr:hypothetical protein DPMN_094337 [Dreissena polymorpha]
MVLVNQGFEQRNTSTYDYEAIKTTRTNSVSATSVTSSNDREPGTTTSDRTYSATSGE